MPPRQPAHHATDLAPIGLSVEDEADLRWFLGDDANNPTRERTIRARLALVPPSHVDVLRAAYGPDLEPSLLAKYGALASGITLPAALVLLMARRRRIPERDLARWLAVPTPAPRPPTTDTDPARVQAAIREHRRTVRRDHEEWLERQAEHLRPLRVAAQLALLAAGAAYQATAAARIDPRR